MNTVNVELWTSVQHVLFQGAFIVEYQSMEDKSMDKEMLMKMCWRWALLSKHTFQDILWTTETVVNTTKPAFSTADCDTFNYNPF